MPIPLNRARISRCKLWAYISTPLTPHGGVSADEWISAGIRPIWFFNKHTGIAFEAGWDHVKNVREDFEGSLYKLTIARQLQYENKFFGRPVIRLFATYAFWDDSLFIFEPRYRAMLAHCPERDCMFCLGFVNRQWIADVSSGVPPVGEAGWRMRLQFNGKAQNVL
jgi:hypothetical protein